MMSVIYGRSVCAFSACVLSIYSHTQVDSVCQYHVCVRWMVMNGDERRLIMFTPSKNSACDAVSSSCAVWYLIASSMIEKSWWFFVICYFGLMIFLSSAVCFPFMIYLCFCFRTFMCHCSPSSLTVTRWRCERYEFTLWEIMRWPNIENKPNSLGIGHIHIFCAYGTRSRHPSDLLCF